MGDNIERHEEKASEYAKKRDAFEDLLDELQSADKIGDTRLSMLFHKARTTPKSSGWESVAAFINIEDGDATVVKHDRLSEGRWSPETREKYDFVLTVSTVPWMESDVFRSLAGDKIRHKIDSLSQNEQHHRTAAQNARLIQQERQ